MNNRDHRKILVIDGKVVIPGVPDKKIVYTLSESYIAPLINNGVKVYKYTPGFRKSLWQSILRIFAPLM